MNKSEMKFHDAVLDSLCEKEWFNNLLHEERDELLSIITHIYSNHKNVISNNRDIERLRSIIADADHVICYLIGNNSPDEYIGVSEILKRMRRENENVNGEFEDDE